MSRKIYTLSPDAMISESKDRYAVYHRVLGGLSLLDRKSYETLMSFKSNVELAFDPLADGDSSPTEELIQQFALRRLIVEADTAYDSAQVATVGKQGRVSVIQLILTNACNFGCTYCFEGIQGTELTDKELDKKVELIDVMRIESPEEIAVNLGDSMYASKERFSHQYDKNNRLMKLDNAIEYTETALEIAKHTGMSEVMLQFFGGEPLLNWKTIKGVLEHFQNGESHGIRINYSTVTNASLVDDEVAGAFAKYNVATCVSFDSPTSPSRPLKNGEDSTPIVVEGLELFKRHGVRLAINSALTSSTWNEFDNSIVDFAKEHGAGEIGVIIDFDPTFYKKYSADEIVDKLWGVMQYGYSQGVVLTGYWHQIFQVLLGFDVVRERGFKNCSAKGAQLSIEPNGSVFSCKAGSGLFGSINKGADLLQSPVYKAHADLRHKNPDFCEGCSIEGFCAGLCLGPIEKKYGTIDAVEPAACEVYRKITHRMIGDLGAYDVATFDLGEALASRESAVLD